MCDQRFPNQLNSSFSGKIKIRSFIPELKNSRLLFIFDTARKTSYSIFFSGYVGLLLSYYQK